MVLLHRPRITQVRIEACCVLLKVEPQCWCLGSLTINAGFSDSWT